MNFLEVLQFTLASIAGLTLSYRLLVSVATLFNKEEEHLKVEKNRKFAIVLLARSDENIARSLYSLSGVVYPKNLYDLIVVTDNLTNKSALVAEKLGAIVLVADQQQKESDTFNLPWVFKQILSWDMQIQYDAIITFNADNLVAGNYLEVMNYYLEQGATIIRGGYRALPEQESWAGEIARIELLMQNYVMPLGNKMLGLPAVLKSNGTCFSTNILRKFAWQNLLQISDLELGLLMRREGMVIEFVPQAVLFVDATLEKEQKKSHHKNGLKIFGKLFREKAISLKMKVVSFLFSTIPTVSQLMSLVLGMFAISVITWSIGITSSIFIWIWAGITITGILHLYTGLKVAAVENAFSKAVIYIPMYIFYRIKNSWKSFWEQRGKRFEKKSDAENSDSVKEKEQIVQ